MRVYNYLCALFLLFSCSKPIIIGSSSAGVHKNHESIFVRFNPTKLENYKGDTLFINNYIIMNYRTASSFHGRQFDYLDEDSVLYDFNSVLLNLGLITKISDQGENGFNENTVFEETKDYYIGIEKNVKEILNLNEIHKNMYVLIPVFTFAKRHDGSGFIGRNPVTISYDVVFFVYIFNEKNELIYKNERSIRAASETIEHWEEARAFPIEDRVKKEHFEEMIMEALKGYLEE